MAIIQNRLTSDNKVVGVILLGCVGCGKGTQMKMLLDKEGYKGYHIDLGGEIRYHLENDNIFRKQHNRTVMSGGLLPDEIALKLVQSRAREIRQEGIIGLDGFCRNRHQADMINHIFTQPRNLLAVEFDIDFETALQRVGERGRPDDNKVHSRFKLWSDNRKYVIRKLTSKGVKIVPVNACGPRESVFEEFHGHLVEHVKNLKSLLPRQPIHQSPHHGSHSHFDRSYPHSGPRSTRE